MEARDAANHPVKGTEAPPQNHHPAQQCTMRYQPWISEGSRSKGPAAKQLIYFPDRRLRLHGTSQGRLRRSQAAGAPSRAMEGVRRVKTTVSTRQPPTASVASRAQVCCAWTLRHFRREPLPIRPQRVVTQGNCHLAYRQGLSCFRGFHLTGLIGGCEQQRPLPRLRSKAPHHCTGGRQSERSWPIREPAL